MKLLSSLDFSSYWNKTKIVQPDKGEKFIQLRQSIYYDPLLAILTIEISAQNRPVFLTDIKIDEKLEIAPKAIKKEVAMFELSDIGF